MRISPRRLREGWKEIGGYIGDFQARLLLTACYFTLLAPFGAIASRFGDPLHLRRTGGTSGWTPRRAEPADLDHARHMF